MPAGACALVWHPPLKTVFIRRLTPFARRWLADETGQDLVEYVLLGATVAFAGLFVFNAFGGVINAVYASWEAATMSLWYPQAPAS